MSDGGEQPARPPRLASALSSPKKTESAKAKDTTLGGVQKTKFAPVIAARRVKKEPTEASAEAVDERPPKRDQDRPGRGRGPNARGGRGRGGKGLLSERPTNPAHVSGPFSMGPSNARGASGSSVTVGFAPPTRSSGRIGGGGGGGGGGGFGGRSLRAGAFSQQSGPVDEGTLYDLNRLIDMESLDLGEDYCPVYIAADSAKKKTMEVESTDRLSDLLESEDGVLLLQLPSVLPGLNAPVEKAEEEQTEEVNPEVPVEGEIGKLLFHESGKVSLEINGVRFTLETAEGLSDLPHITGSQSIVAIDPEYEQSFELAEVRHTLLGSLDFSSILKS